MGQKSNVDKLPPRLRKKLFAMLQDPACTQAQIAGAINADAGKEVLSTSGVNRYAKRMARFAEKARQAREVAEAYLARMGGDTSVPIGKVINEQIRLVTMDLIMELDRLKDEEELDTRAVAEVLQKISRAVQSLETAEKTNMERAAKAREEALRDAAETASAAARAAGLSQEAAEEIKAKIVGL